MDVASEELVRLIVGFLCSGLCCLVFPATLGGAIFFFMRKKKDDAVKEDDGYAGRNTEPLTVNREPAPPPVATGPVAEEPKVQESAAESAPEVEEEVQKPKRNPTLIFSPDDALEDE